MAATAVALSLSASASASPRCQRVVGRLRSPSPSPATCARWLGLRHRAAAELKLLLGGLSGRRRRRQSARPAEAVASPPRLEPVEDEEDEAEDPDDDWRSQDYYSALGLEPDASAEEVKQAYYASMRLCHPDLSGNHPESTAFCMYLNEAYEVLSDVHKRTVYDEINGFSISATNPFEDTKFDADKVFVDEFSCIGCKNCAHCAPATFMIEEDFGRARAMKQDDNVAMVQEAIDTCPVSCIHWVTAPQLKLLEDEMRRVERVNVGAMMSGMGLNGADVFSMAQDRWHKRQVDAFRRVEMEAAKKAKKAGTWWQWGWGVESVVKNARRRGGTSAVQRAERWQTARNANREVRYLPSPREEPAAEVKSARK
eukprot:jgi/Chlat1/7748/Chrsp66S07214